VDRRQVFRRRFDSWKNSLTRRKFSSQLACCFGSQLGSQTHNIALIRPLAGFTVALGLDGQILSQSSIQNALEHDARLSVEASEDQSRLESAKARPKEATPPTKKLASGKLIVAEEIVEGNVSWSPGSYYVLTELALTLMSASATISTWTGWGSPPILFHNVVRRVDSPELCWQPSDVVPGLLVLPIRHPVRVRNPSPIVSGS
jgi:hypothetical protein